MARINLFMWIRREEGYLSELSESEKKRTHTKDGPNKQTKKSPKNWQSIVRGAALPGISFYIELKTR